MYPLPHFSPHGLIHRYLQLTESEVAPSATGGSNVPRAIRPFNPSTLLLDPCATLTQNPFYSL